MLFLFVFCLDGRARKRTSAHSSRRLSSHERQFLTSSSLALNFCIAYCSRAVLGRKRHFKHQLISPFCALACLLRVSFIATSASIIRHTKLYNPIRLQVVNLDANWGNSPDNARSTPLYIVTLTNAPIIFNVGLQGLAAQSTMEAELTAAAPTMKGDGVLLQRDVEAGLQ